MVTISFVLPTDRLLPHDDKKEILLRRPWLPAVGESMLFIREGAEHEYTVKHVIHINEPGSPVFAQVVLR